MLVSFFVNVLTIFWLKEAGVANIDVFTRGHYENPLLVVMMMSFVMTLGHMYYENFHLCRKEGFMSWLCAFLLSRASIVVLCQVGEFPFPCLQVAVFMILLVEFCAGPAHQRENTSFQLQGAVSAIIVFISWHRSFNFHEVRFREALFRPAVAGILLGTATCCLTRHASNSSSISRKVIVRVHGKECAVGGPLRGGCVWFLCGISVGSTLRE